MARIDAANFGIVGYRSHTSADIGPMVRTGPCIGCRLHYSFDRCTTVAETRTIKFLAISTARSCRTAAVRDRMPSGVGGATPSILYRDPGSLASHACHPLEEMARNLTPDKRLVPSSACWSASRPMSSTRRLRGRQQQSCKNGRPMNSVPRIRVFHLHVLFCVWNGRSVHMVHMDYNLKPNGEMM
jgi:hypothetical protein